jgi:hypothetical protein
MNIREVLEMIKKHCETTESKECAPMRCEIGLPPEEWNIDKIIKILGIQEKAPRKRKKPIPTIELAIQVVADMERGTSFCTAYRRLNLPEAKLRIVINSDKELLARYKKAILITKTERQKKYWKG